MDIFNEIEKDFPVDQWKINDIHIWPHLRIQICVALNRVNHGNSIMSQGNSSNVSSFTLARDLSFQHKIRIYLRIKIRAIVAVLKRPFLFLKYGFTWRKINESKFDLLFLAVTSTTVELMNKWFNIQNDPFLSHLEGKNIASLVLERSNGVPFLKPLFFPDDHFNLDAYVEGYLWKNKVNVENHNDHLDRYNEFTAVVKKRFPGYNLEGVISIQKLTEQVVKIQSIANLFIEIITNSGIKICFITNIDTIIGMALCHACRKLNIPSVDLQHGIQGDLHAGYNRWHNIPSEGYSILPSIFWNWSKEQQMHIDKWAINSGRMHRSICGGSAWVNMWKNKQNKLASNYDKEMAAITNNDSNQVYVLYTMQPFFADTLSDRVIEAYKNSPSNWKWWFRLHPRQLEKGNKIIEDVQKVISINKSDILLPSELPLPLLLSFANVHVTPTSSVVLEAEFFSVPSVVTDPAAPVIYQEQLKNGIMVYSDEDNDLISSIKQQLKYKVSSVEGVDSFKEFDLLLNECGVG
ncbi:MAG: hypothetical protein JKX76_03605 [Colwellia sp.]|nr:hypothetical protein [Colwellia sp.]